MQKLTGEQLTTRLIRIRHAMTSMFFSLTKYLYVSSLFSMLNGRKDNTYHICRLNSDKNELGTI